MKYLAFLAVLLGVVFALTIHDAEAQIAGNKAFTFSGSGFAVSGKSISDSVTEITFSVTQTKTKSEFTLQGGVITVDQKDWTLSDFSGSMLQNGKLFRLYDEKYQKINITIFVFDESKIVKFGQNKPRN